jgi:hypothetical protein
VAVWLAAPPTVMADPITITSGVMTVPSRMALAPMTLTGTDGTRMFTFAGVIRAGDDYIGPTNCFACVSLRLGIIASAFGTVTYGNESYPVSPAGPDRGIGYLLFFVPDDRIPLPVPVATGETQTFSAPVTASGSAHPPEGDPFNPNPGLIGGSLTGSGIATVTLVGTVVPSAPSGGYWDFVRAEYQFSAPAPIPEPTSFLLFASGLSALVLKRRSEKRWQ